MITVDGLTKRDLLLADRIWACEGRAEVDSFIASLPKTEAARALVILELMTEAVYDQFLQDQEQFPEAEMVLDRIKNL